MSKKKKKLIRKKKIAKKKNFSKKNTITKKVKSKRKNTTPNSLYELIDNFLKKMTTNK